MSTISQVNRQKIKRLKDSFHALMWISMRQFSQQLQQYNLTQPQFVALASLAVYKQACTMSDLTSVTLQDPPTMTGIVDRLVKMGLVKRSRSETDRRVVLVQITPAGQELIQKIDQDFMESEFDHYAHFSDDELDTFENFIWILLRILVGRHRDIPMSELDKELDNLQEFMNNPIRYIRSENNKIR